MSGLSVVSSFLAGPGDPMMPRDEISGYQGPTRVGERVLNCFVDPYEWEALPLGSERPHFHEWATAHAGMVLITRKKKSENFRFYQAAETAMPVIACAAGLDKAKRSDFHFAGICRTKSVRTIDDTIGPKEDEYFTATIGGMQTVLNTSGDNIYVNDLIEWTLEPAHEASKKRKSPLGPLRIGVKRSTPSSPYKFGRALSFAKKGELMDVLVFD